MIKNEFEKFYNFNYKIEYVYQKIDVINKDI